MPPPAPAFGTECRSRFFDIKKSKIFGKPLAIGDKVWYTEYDSYGRVWYVWWSGL